MRIGKIGNAYERMVEREIIKHILDVTGYELYNIMFIHHYNDIEEWISDYQDSAIMGFMYD
jgi:hypothetical protein